MAKKTTAMEPRRSVALVVTQPPMLLPAEYDMYDRLATKAAQSDLCPEWAKGRPANLLIAFVNGHALGLAPAIAMNNGFVVNGHYDLFGQAYLALAQARDPGFRYQIDEWDETKIALTGWRDGLEQRYEVKLTAAQLARNSRTAGNPSFKSNPADHLLWKASKRLVKLVTPAVTLGLALPTEEQIEAEPPPPMNPARVLEVAAGAAPAAQTPAAQSPVEKLSGLMRDRFGALSKPQALQKATVIFNMMVKAETGKNPGKVFASVKDISPEDAQRMCAYLEKSAGAAADTEGRSAPDPKESDAGEEPAAAPAAPPKGPAPPPLEEEPQEQGASWESLMRAVERARKLFHRKFVQEAPADSGVLWFTNQEIVKAVKERASIMLQENGAITVSDNMLALLERELVALCDKHERGRP